MITLISMTDHELQLKAIRLRKLTLEAIVGAGGDNPFIGNHLLTSPVRLINSASL
jgi:hypothetical protein